MRSLILEEDFFEKESTAVVFILVQLVAGVAMAAELVDWGAELGWFCIFAGVFFAISECRTVRKIDILEDEIHFFSRFKIKRLKKKKIDSIVTTSSPGNTIVFKTANEKVVVSHGFTGMAQLVEEIRANNPRLEVKGL